MPVKDYPLISDTLAKRSIKYPKHYKGWRILRPLQIEFTRLESLSSPTSWIPALGRPSLVGLFDQSFTTPPPTELVYHELWNLKYYPTRKYIQQDHSFKALAIWCETCDKMNIVRWFDAAGAIAYMRTFGRTKLPYPITRKHETGDPLTNAISTANREKLLALCEQTGYADLARTGQSTSMSIRVSGSTKRPTVRFE